MHSIDLDGMWKVRPEGLACKGETGLRRVGKQRGGWIAARVPGEIHLDLIRAGKMEEPLVSANAPKCRWPEKRSWWYRRTFGVADAFLKEERQQLIFEGLDLYAQVFLNDAFLGEAKNAFVPAVFDVRHKLVKGQNELVVRLTAGDEILPEELRPTKGDPKAVFGARAKFPGRDRLRKPQFTYGWDWVDALPNIGIWRGVSIEGRSHVALRDIRCDTHICDDVVFLEAIATVDNLHPWSERACTLELTIAPPTGKKIVDRTRLAAQVGFFTVERFIEIPEARLWWPNGMGDQPLYHVSARILGPNGETDRREMDIGLRTVEIDRSPIKSGGSRFCIQVNGQDVFCKGGNWIPPDAIIARTDKARYGKLIADAKNANFNMLRVWGGGIFEDPAFYDACDRAGILVWHDFMFACAMYPDHDPHFRAAVRAEAEAAVESLRHHPCIALWSGNNENIWGFNEWWNRGKTGFEQDVKLGGAIIYNQILPDVCRNLDPRRPYWPSSPAGGERPNSETDGDCHWWGQFTMNPDMNRRIRHEVFDECKARFVSEYGVIGPCDWESIKEYLKPGERHQDSRAWKEHTNQFEKDTLAAGIRRHYSEPEGLTIPEYILYGQMFQAIMYAQSLEALRFRKLDPRDDCQGAIIWMYNDCWGETGWTPIDYYLRRKASYYRIRNALCPIRAIVRGRGRKLVTRVINDSLRTAKATVHFGWMRIDGTENRMKSRAIRIVGNSMVQVHAEPIPGKSALNPSEWIYAAWLDGEGVELCPSIWSLAPYREMSMAKPAIEVEVRGSGIRVASNVYCHGVHIKDRGEALVSDNYFDLLPGVPKTVRWLRGAPPRNPRFMPLPHCAG